MGKSQTWDPEQYARTARYVSELGRPLIELLNPDPGERILDLGCGDGALTLELAEAGLQVIGIDGSKPQVIAAGSKGLCVSVMDACNLAFAPAFDAVFSNAVLHWIKQPDEVIAGVWRSLKPGGRFVAEFGGHGNIQRVESVLTSALNKRGVDANPANPWYFPTPDDYAGKLEAGGFSVESIRLIPRPTQLPGNMTDWLETFAGTFTYALPEPDRPAYLSEVCDTLRPHLCSASGEWTVDYVRLRLRAIKSER